MRKSVHELNRLPTEFHEDGAPELPELPDEFNRFPRPAKAKEDRSRLRKVMLYLAAAGVVTLGALSPRVHADLPSKADENASVAQTTRQPSGKETDAPVSTIEPSVTPAPTPTPEPKATSTPEPTHAPTPIPTPGVDVGFYYRSSLVYYAMLTISEPEQVSAVSLRLKAPNEEEPALEVELTPQEIANGFYNLRAGDRDEGFDANTFFAHHAEADLLMELTYTVQGEAGEETVVETMEPAVEDWIYWGFDSADDVDFTEMMFGTAFPNCFVVRIFDTTVDLQMTVGSDAESLKNGDVTISIQIDGREIPAQGSRFIKGGPWPDEDGSSYYICFLVIPIPEDFPQQGTATLTLTRKLIHSDTILVNVKDNVEYSKKEYVDN